MADSANKRNIPIQFNRDFSVIDTEFSSIRERFDNEMKRMEDGKSFKWLLWPSQANVFFHLFAEMNKFRSELMNRESNFFETTSRWAQLLTSFNFFSPYFLFRCVNFSIDLEFIFGKYFLFFFLLSTWNFSIRLPAFSLLKDITEKRITSFHVREGKCQTGSGPTGRAATMKWLANYLSVSRRTKPRPV